MKRLITILTLAALISGISVAAFATPTDTEDVLVQWNIGNWIILWIPSEDQSVVLEPVWEGEAYPIFVSVGGPFSVSVWTSLPGGFVLRVRAGVSAPPGVRVAHWFDIQGGVLEGTWHHLGATRILLRSGTSGSFSAHNIDYRFRFNPRHHPPGDYTLTIIYTVTAN